VFNEDEFPKSKKSTSTKLQQVYPLKGLFFVLKVDFRVQKIHIHLYFIALQYLGNNALVEHLYN